MSFSLSSIISGGIQEGLSSVSYVTGGVGASALSQIGGANKSQSLVTITDTKNTTVSALLPLSSTINGQSYQTYRYPLELQGNSAEAPQHAVMFFVNAPESSQYNTNFDNSATPNYLQSAVFATSGGNLSSTDVNKAAYGPADISKQNAVVLTLAQKQRRIKTAIALYMPDTIATHFTHNWNAVSLTSTLGTLGAVAPLLAGFAESDTTMGDIIKTGEQFVTDIVSQFKDNPLDALRGVGKAIGSDPGVLEAATVKAAGMAGIAGAEQLAEVLLQKNGYAVNPQLEMVYGGTSQREFVFEFRFIPRSQSEANSVNEIIKRFKMYAAPSLVTGDRSYGGRYWVPPCSFDIQFMFKNSINEKLPKLSTCVLEDIQLDYSHGGQFATYDDGMPMSIGMQLRFREMDYIYAQMIEQLKY